MKCHLPKECSTAVMFSTIPSGYCVESRVNVQRKQWDEKWYSPYFIVCVVVPAVGSIQSSELRNRSTCCFQVEPNSQQREVMWPQQGYQSIFAFLPFHYIHLLYHRNTAEMRNTERNESWELWKWEQWKSNLLSQWRRFYEERGQRAVCVSCHDGIKSLKEMKW